MSKWIDILGCNSSLWWYLLENYLTDDAMPYYARASREEKLQAQNKHNLLVLAFLLRLEELD